VSIVLGGVPGGRKINYDDPFEVAVKNCLGDKMLEDKDICCKLWGALANQEWQHSDGYTVGYSFRAAGDLIAAILNNGDYLDWYCSYSHPVIEPEIREALATQNWTPIPSDIPITRYKN
jgi:hypothetical protein